MSIQRISRPEMRRLRGALRTRRAIEHERALRWLVMFAQTPLTQQSSTDLGRIREKIEAFQRICVSGLVTVRTDSTRARLRPISVGRIRAMQRHLADLFESLWPRDPLSVNQQTILLEPKHTRVLLTHASTGHVARSIAAPWPDAFWWLVIVLLEHYGVRIRRCMARQGSTRCGHLFIRTRRQTHCSKACARRELSRQRYERHCVEARRRRRAAYARHKGQITSS